MFGSSRVLAIAFYLTRRPSQHTYKTLSLGARNDSKIFVCGVELHHSDLPNSEGTGRGPDLFRKEGLLLQYRPKPALFFI